MERHYSITVQFVTDRTLLIEELHALETACFVQVDDPAGLNDERRASFRVLTCEVESDGMASDGWDEEDQ
jgi:hypothetical protein